MEIITKKRFQFGDANTKWVSQGNMIIETAPDWIEKDPLFALAVDDGDLTVLQTVKTVRKRAVKKEPEAAE